MPCCLSEITLRRSSRGTQFFAHRVKGECSTVSETEAHLILKRIAVEVARRCGWDAMTEVGGVSPDGQHWIADVLAQKGRARIAIEVQWSAQTAEETHRRQAIYERSGVRALWLMRRLTVAPTVRVPAVQVSSADNDYAVTLGSGQKMPAADFLVAAFEGRFRFGLPEGAVATVSADEAPAWCWKCGALTKVITEVHVDTGPERFSFSLPETGDMMKLFSPIYELLPADPLRGAIKGRYSRTQQHSYLSNGCAHCDALFGEFQSLDLDAEPTPVLSTDVRMTADWVRFLSSPDASSWGTTAFPNDAVIERSACGRAVAGKAVPVLGW